MNLALRCRSFLARSGHPQAWKLLSRFPNTGAQSTMEYNEKLIGHHSERFGAAVRTLHTILRGPIARFG